MVAKLPCVVCGSKPVECHHIRTGQGLGRKAADEECLSLCINHHRGPEGFHTLGKRAWEAKYGMQVDLLEKVKVLLNG